MQVRRPRGVIAAGHELTARAGEAVLGEGGNAYDAVLAAMCAACIAEPVLASLGGGGFLLALTGEGQSGVFDFFVHTPRVRRSPGEIDFHEATVDFGEEQQLFHIGPGTMATPGVVRGLFEVHRELATMPMRDIVAPAIELARDGVRVNEFQGYIFDIVAPIVTATEQARAVFGSPIKDHGPVKAGDILRQPAMADVLDALAHEGDDLFYRGEIGRSIADLCLAGGGHLTRDDLERYEVVRHRPLTMDYRGAELSINPPPSTGGVLIAFAFALLERVEDLAARPFDSVGHLDLLARVMGLTELVRIESLASGEAAPDPRQLLDEEFLAAFRGQVLGLPPASRGTTHISVIDGRGNVATMTLSNGEGSGHIVPETGIMLNNMLGEDDLSPHGLHEWKTGVRMSSMMAPATLRWPGGRTVATGSGGSKRIRSSILQVLVNLIDYGMAVQDAVAAPRIHFDDELLSIEGGFREPTVRELTRTYPNHRVWDDLNLFFGGAHTVERRDDRFAGAGDPRRGGVCLIL